MKKLLSLLLAALLLSAAAQLPAFAAAAPLGTGFTAGGVTGSCEWSYNSTRHLLSISGSGATADYDFDDPAPWAEYAGSIRRVVISDGVTSLGSCALYEAAALTQVSLTSDLTRIGRNAFNRCSSLEVIELPDSLTTLEAGAFCMTGLKSITIPGSVKTVGSYAFSDCESLESVVIERGVETLKTEAFYNCGWVTEVSVPSSVTTIEQRALGYEDDDIMGYQVVYGFTIKGVINSAAHDYAMDNDGITFIAVNPVVSGVSGDCAWSLNTETGEMTVSGSGAMADYDFPLTNIPWYTYRDTISKLTVKKNVTKIGKNSFRDCLRMTAVTLPSTLTAIGESAFCGSGIRSVKLPNGVKTVEANTFYGCLFLQSVDLSSKLTEIGTDAFSGCERLYSVVLPCSLKTVKQRAFFDCGLEDITVPAAVTEIGRYAFGYYASWSDEGIPERLDRFDINGFSGTQAQTYAAQNSFPFLPLKMGDADDNEIVDIRDVTAIQRHAAKYEALTNVRLLCGDANADGAVNVKDATLMQRYLAGFKVVLGKQS